MTIRLSDVHFLRHGNLQLTEGLLPIGETATGTNQLRLERIVINEQNKDEYLHMMVAGTVHQ